MKLIRWYIIIWTYIIIEIKKGKGLYKMTIGEAKWWFMFGSSAIRTLAISIMSAVFLNSPQPINIFKFLTGDNFILGLFVYFFIPIYLFDYFLVFYKDRYKKYEHNLPTKVYNWWIWMGLFLILPALIFLSGFAFLVYTR